MRPIDRADPFDATTGVVTPDLNPKTASSAPSPASAMDQPTETPDPGEAAGKRMERDLEAAYFKGTLDNAGPHPGTPVLYDKNAKPDGNAGRETARPVSAPLRVADAGDDANLEVRAAAGHLVGQKVIGSGECFDLADQVLKEAGAKSAADFEKVTKSRDQDYKWGTPIDPKTAKPGDILQFRDHQITKDTVKKITKTYPDGHSEQSVSKESTTYNRSPQHTSVVLSNDGDGKMEVAEQHVLDRDTNKLSSTVRKNDLYTQDVPATTTVKHRMEGKVTIKEETTVTISVSGKVWAYRPQPKDSRK